MPRITLNFIKKISTERFLRPKSFWDDSLKGFGVRCQGKGISYVLMYRNSYGVRRLLTIGKVGSITPEQAREIAKTKLADVIKGLDPAELKKQTKKTLTVANLCDWYLKEGTSLKKERTIRDDIGRINNHIKPIIGKFPVESIKRANIEKLLLAIETGQTIQKHTTEKRHGHFASGGVGVANRVYGLLGAIFEFAKNREIIAINPCRGIKRPADKTRDAFLTLEDVKVLGKTLSNPELKALYNPGLNIIKLILLTGCRREEIASLRWEYVDFNAQCFRFPDTKTGKQNRPFGLGAKHLLINLYNGQKNGYVFPSISQSGYNRSANRVFDKIRQQKEENGIPLIRPDLTIHGLRHSFASIAADMGYSDFTIAGLLGHRLGTVTSRYTHAIDKSLISAADTISLKIEQALLNQEEKSAQIINIK